MPGIRNRNKMPSTRFTASTELYAIAAAVEVAWKNLKTITWRHQCMLLACEGGIVGEVY